MKQKRRIYDVHISPNNLIVGSWSRPIPKHEKRMSIVSAIIFIICVVTIIVFEKAEYSSTVITDFLGLVIPVATITSFFLSLLAPIHFLSNQFQRFVMNEEAKEEMRKREEREEQERIAEEAGWAN